jgi:dihydropteroate synthase
VTDGRRVLPVVMGVVNVTPDSFSDGGLYADAASAIAHGRQLLADGADILDIGGESTRPGATRPLVEEELGRVIPVITALAEDGAMVSVDTMRHQVAAAALAAGARIVNDVSGGLADPDILRVVADAEATYVAMHWRAHADHMNDFATYDNPGGVVVAVRDELAARVEAALAAGVAPERLVIDPGLGFAKRGEHNWQLLADLGPIKALGHPVLVGAGRKSFLGTLLADAEGRPRPVDGRDDATTALSVLLAQEGVWGLRVHDVRSTRDALRVLDALETAREERG